MTKPLLSICIPTYNRVESLLALIRDILSSKCEDLEVVVSDNASSDGTISNLYQVRDKRLQILAHTINEGSFSNIVSALCAGNAAYSLLLLDKDCLDICFLEDFIACLQTKRPASGFCRHGMPRDTLEILHRIGIDSVNSLAYQCHHPSGYFFDSTLLKKIDFKGRFSGGGAYGHFFLDAVHAEMALLGPTLEYRKPLIIPESLANGTKPKSLTTNAAIALPFYHPSERKRITVLFTLHLLSLNLSRPAKRSALLLLLKRGLIQATIGYATAVSNPLVASHYGDKTRRVGMVELLSVGLYYIYNCLASTQSARKACSMPSSASLILALMYAGVLRGCAIVSRKVLA